MGQQCCTELPEKEYKPYRKIFPKELPSDPITETVDTVEKVEKLENVPHKLPVVAIPTLFPEVAEVMERLGTFQPKSTNWQRG